MQDIRSNYAAALIILFEIDFGDDFITVEEILLDRI